ncbi:60S ribosomal protein L30 [Triticum urartu]|uniref:60S ribosomal protein L30 n=1 Tax=Triticum urartu TaxID=4572 RepID=M7YSN9_TRIUA|nr:60S ribosomal protein L30 [Triticum urartu]
MAWSSEGGRREDTQEWSRASSLQHDELDEDLRGNSEANRRRGISPVQKKKKSRENIKNKMQLVIKSGKYTLGYKTVLKTLRGSKEYLTIEWD